MAAVAAAAGLNTAAAWAVMCCITTVAVHRLLVLLANPTAVACYGLVCCCCTHHVGRHCQLQSCGSCYYSCVVMCCLPTAAAADLRCVRCCCTLPPAAWLSVAHVQPYTTSPHKRQAHTCCGCISNCGTIYWLLGPLFLPKPTTAETQRQRAQYRYRGVSVGC